MVVVGFHTISEALAVEKAAKEGGIPGRLGPVPREVSVGCGYAWLVDEGTQAEVQHLLEEKALNFEAVVTI